MRRTLMLVAATCSMVALAAPVALADNAHFIKAGASLNADGSLTASFKEAGLGSNQNINYALTGDGTAVYVCVNGGGSNPSAQNKTAVNGPVIATGTFSSGKNGSISASLTVDPPASTNSCPNGQKEMLASVSYSNMEIADTTNGVSVALGDFASGCLLPRVRGACD